jgi:hypothetical protein
MPTNLPEHARRKLQDELASMLPYLEELTSRERTPEEVEFITNMGRLHGQAADPSGGQHRDCAGADDRQPVGWDSRRPPGSVDSWGYGGF